MLHACMHRPQTDATDTQPLAGPPAEPVRVRQPSWLVALLAVAVIAASAISGAWLVGLAQSPDGGNEAPSATPVPRLPGRDVPGRNIADLPRFPDAVRTEYRRGRQGSSLVTELRYLADAQLDDVRSFYRRTFREHGWEVVELDFTRGEWVFVVSSGRRVALVEIQPHGPFIQVDLELEVSAREPRPPTRSEPTPPPPPPPDDDDDDGVDDDGTDD